MATKSFIQKKHKLERISKLLQEVNKGAIDALVSVMNSTQDERIKKECAKELIHLDIEVTKLIEADKLQRAVLDVRLFNNGVNNSLNWIEPTAKPSVCFDTILIVE